MLSTWVTTGPKARRIPDFLRGVKVTLGRHSSDVHFFMNLASSFSAFLPFVDVPSFGAGGWLDEPGVLGCCMLLLVYFKVSSLFTLGAAMAAPKMVPYSVHNIELNLQGR